MTNVSRVPMRVWTCSTSPYDMILPVPFDTYLVTVWISLLDSSTYAASGAREKVPPEARRGGDTPPVGTGPVTGGEAEPCLKQATSARKRIRQASSEDGQRASSTLTWA